MNSVIMIFGILISSQCTVTSYQSLKSQTDDSPFFTSIDEHVGTHVVAASKDLLCPRAKIRVKPSASSKSFILCHRGILCPNKKAVHYKDWVFLPEIGFKQVLDVMNPRHKNHFDVWVRSLSEEKAFGVRKMPVFHIKKGG